MTSSISSSPQTHALRHTLSEAADRADRRLADAAHASERAHRQMERALHRSPTDQLDALHERRWSGRMDPLVNRLSSKAQQLARQSMDLASSAGQSAQASWNRYADATTGYVVRQPVRSVLIAAGVGAALALLVAAGRKRY